MVTLFSEKILQKCHEKLFVSTDLIVMPSGFKKHSVNKTNWKIGRMMSGNYL